MCGMKASLLLLGGGWRNEIEEEREREGCQKEEGRKENVGLVGKPASASGSGNLKTGDRQVGSLAW